MVFCRTVFLLSLLTVVGLSAAEPEESRPIGPGVTFTRISRPAEPYEIRVIRIWRSTPEIRLDMVMSRDRLNGVEPISDAVARMEKRGRQVIAGVNGDFYIMAPAPMAGLTLGPSVSEGRLVSTGRQTLAFYLTADGVPHISPLTFAGTLTSEKTTLTLRGVNWKLEPKYSEIMLYTRDWGWPVPADGVRIKLQRGPLLTAGIFPGVVSGAFKAGETVGDRADDAVLVGTGDLAVTVRALAGKVEIEPSYRETKQSVLMAVGSWQVLLKDGEIPFKEGPRDPRHPRTMIGYNDREILLVTVDGRQPGWSKGMRSIDQARLLLELGCTDGANIDGGGSTTVWVRGKVENRPSDGGLRHNANAVLLSTRLPVGKNGRDADGN